MSLQLATSDQSWVALLASTVGLEGFARRRVRLLGAVPVSGEVRVVVQVFGADARPLGAAERIVSAASLEGGLALDVVYEGGGRSTRVVAWVEPDVREYEFGALTSKPDRALAWAEGPSTPGETTLRLTTEVVAAA